MYHAILLYEVLDKEPPAIWFWKIFLPVAVVGFILCRFYWQLIAIILPFTLLLGWAITSELREPFVGEAIYAESKVYIFQVYAGWLTAVLFPCVGALIGLKRQNKAKG